MRQSMIRQRLPSERRSPIPPPPPEGALPTRPSRLPVAAQSPRDEAEALVRRLAGCGPSDVAEPIQRLVWLGEPALDVLARAFPGTLWPKACAVPPSGFTTRSAIAAALVAFGDAAWPHVEWLMQAPGAGVRARACAMVRALPRAELLNALGPLLVDEDRDVREAALSALRDLPASAPRSELLLDVRERLLPRHEPKLRRRALEVLVELREPTSAASLVELLRDEDRALARRAHFGLTRLTGHDFGNLRDGWSRWLSSHQSRPREEWLRSGLSDQRPELAALAAAELAALDLK